MMFTRRQLWNTVGIGVMLIAQSEMQIAKAQTVAPACEVAPNLVGNYAFQFTGTINLPAPFNAYNGYFYRNGRLVADGNGNITTTTVVANYAGTIVRETFNATYAVKPDGTFTVTIQNLAIPAFPPGTPDTFSFDGVLYNCGGSAKIVLSGVSLLGMPQANIGSVIAGQLERQ
jgi:hypothetical protein